MLTIWGLLGRVALLSLVLASTTTGSLSEELEYDICTCKTIQTGAQSTFKGGVCQRTESSKCQLDWGSTGNDPVNVGNGMSKRASVEKAETQIKQVASDFNVVPVNGGERLPPMELALRNLAQVNPDGYRNAGMMESFLLVVASALVRFDAPIDVLTTDVFLKRREEMENILVKEGSIEAGPYRIQGAFGCMKVSYTGKDGRSVEVFIKTPFAEDKRC